MSELRAAALGKWPSILPLLGVSPSFLTKHHGPCPMCGGKDRFRFDDRGGAGGYICNGCGAGDGFKLVMGVNRWDFAEAAKRIEALLPGAALAPAQKEPPAEKAREAKNKLWKECRRLTAGDVVDRYLRGRGIELEAYPPSLRFGPRIRYQDGLEGTPSYHPAMVAMVVDRGGKPLTLHRTYLTADGRKASVPKPKKIMSGKDDMKGRSPAIRLAEPRDGVLGIAEGIETALSASLLHGVPCWAVVSATMLQTWEPPEDVTDLWVFGDHDPNFAGQAAAGVLAHRAYTSGRKVNVAYPPRLGDDWNDELLRERGVALEAAE